MNYHGKVVAAIPAQGGAREQGSCRNGQAPAGIPPSLLEGAGTCPWAEAGGSWT